MQLALRDEEEFTSIDLVLNDGTLDLSGQDMGPMVRRLQGDADYAEHYKGDLSAVQKVRGLAERHEIEPNFGTWA